MCGAGFYAYSCFAASLCSSVLIVFFWIASSVSATTTTVCPPGEFATVGNKSFYWNGTNTYWEEARIRCPENATLAVVESAAEMQALKDKGELGETKNKEKKVSTLTTCSNKKNGLPYMNAYY